MIELKNIPLLTRGFRRAFGIGTEVGGVDRLNEAISPTFDMFRDLEFRVLRGELSGSAVMYVAAGGAGTRSYVQLWNPADSNRLVVCTRIYAETAPVNIGIDLQMVTTRATAQNGLRDTRTKRIWTTDYDPQLLGQIRTSNAGAASGTNYIRWRVLTGEYSDLQFVVGPGHGLNIDPGADNTAVNCGLAWRERDLLPGERPGELQ